MKHLYKVAAFVGTFSIASFAYADGMWDATTTVSQLTTSFADIGTIFAYAIGAILLAWAGLVGLGFGLRKARKYVTGRHF